MATNRKQSNERLTRNPGLCVETKIQAEVHLKHLWKNSEAQMKSLLLQLQGIEGSHPDESWRGTLLI